MQGYILNIVKVKDEDLIVHLLTNKELISTYRFYGARHSTINVGFKIDFELEESARSEIHRLKNVIHLGFPWILNSQKMYVWQQFLSKFYEHLRENKIDTGFYFNLLENASNLWEKQSAKRVGIEVYLKLLQHEGRLHFSNECFLCDKIIAPQQLTLARAFLPAHNYCAKKNVFTYESIHELFKNKSTLFLDDKAIDRLFEIILEGF